MEEGAGGQEVGPARSAPCRPHTPCPLPFEHLVTFLEACQAAKSKDKKTRLQRFQKQHVEHFRSSPTDVFEIYRLLCPKVGGGLGWAAVPQGGWVGLGPGPARHAACSMAGAASTLQPHHPSCNPPCIPFSK